MREMILLLSLLGDDRSFFERRDVDFWGKKSEIPATELWADSTAPPPVRRLIEAPSPENARAYLAWQEERFRRLRSAIAAVEKESKVSPNASILYFSRPGCRWCALQEEDLQGLPVTRVAEDSPLWKEHGVSVTPTLVVNGKLFRGLTPRATLVKELSRE
jgi:hypothetical protein